MFRNRIIFVFLIAATLGGLGWFVFHEGNGRGIIPQPPSSPSPGPKASFLNPPGLPSVHAQFGDFKTPDPSSPHDPAQPRPTLEENQVEFQMHDGLAVAFGDVVLGKPDPSFTGQSGVVETHAPEIWKTNTIPYSIAPGFPNPTRVEQAIQYLNQHTSVKFVRYQGEPDSIVFQQGEKHCYSYMGKMGGAQPIFLAGDCAWPEILHEMLHALGFFHEQSRPDRDQYVSILWDNIDGKFRNQFDKVPESWSDVIRDSSFDYSSIMLYRPNSFAKAPGLITMQSTKNTQVAPEKDGLSGEDIRRINRLYSMHD